MPLMLYLIKSPTADARALIAELDAELAGRYAAEQRHGLSVDRVFRPTVLFFIARLDGDPVGCGAVAFDDELAEVKRMYVRPHARGRGVARAILTRLEVECRLRKFDRMYLETGDAQAAAIRLYEHVGFIRCGAFGAYCAMLPNAVERSVFFEKRIG
jgi:putative acetyltransferase